MNPRSPLRHIKHPGLGRFAALTVLILGAGLTSSCMRHEVEVTLFEDVTEKSGLGNYEGMTHGAAWGDYDGDGLPDLYVTNHLNAPLLFRNLGGGRFADVTGTFFSPDELTGDKHGAVWADFDNDGRPDLVQLTGAVRGVGVEPKRLFHNMGDRFADVAEAMGVLNQDGRTRMPLWFDFNQDGRLDLFHGAEARLDDKTPPFLYVQGKNGFSASTPLAFGSRSVPFCILADLTGDNRPELVCRIVGKNRTAQIFDLAAHPPRDLDLLPATAYEDAVAADFDNDGRMDIFLARKNPPGAVAFGQPANNVIVADVSVNKGNVDKPLGFSFRTKGALSLRAVAVDPTDALSPERIHLGQQGAHPSSLAFDVSSASPGIAGVAPHTWGKESGVYVGFTAPDKWEVHITSQHEALAAGKPKHQQIQMRVASSTPITNLEAIGEAIKPEEAPARLFMNRGGKLVEESEKRGVNARPVAAVNVVAGDFDNDMDVDLFVVASGDIGKQKNMLLLNRGDGYFDVASNAGGAAGGMVGVGDSVTVVDFDRDGFLDLFVATGGSMGRSEGPSSEGGSYQLYRNVRNSNHWIEIDLVGTSSNRDGIGASVYVTAGGVTQVRVQDGGVHNRGQNFQRLHFGMAKNTQIEKILVYWPSGTIQELSKVATDQVIRLKEPMKTNLGNLPITSK